MPEEHDGVRYWEGLNGRREDDDTVTILGVPAYAYDLNLGDRVHASSPMGNPTRVKPIFVHGPSLALGFFEAAWVNHAFLLRTLRFRERDGA